MKMKLKDYRTNVYLLAFIIACMRYVLCLEPEDTNFFNNKENVSLFFCENKL